MGLHELWIGTRQNTWSLVRVTCDRPTSDVCDSLHRQDRYMHVVNINFIYPCYCRIQSTTNDPFTVIRYFTEWLIIHDDHQRRPFCFEYYLDCRNQHASLFSFFVFLFSVDTSFRTRIELFSASTTANCYWHWFLLVVVVVICLLLLLVCLLIVVRVRGKFTQRFHSRRVFPRWDTILRLVFFWTWSL